MKVLLDTHVVIWALTDDARLSEQSRRTISNFDPFDRMLLAQAKHEKYVDHPKKTARGLYLWNSIIYFIKSK